MENQIVSEQDVVAFLGSKVRELSAKTGVGYANIRCEVCGFRDDELRIEWISYVDGDNHRHAAMVDGAIGLSVAAMAPAARAKELREKAEAMLREAAELSSQGNPVPTSTGG